MKKNLIAALAALACAAPAAPAAAFKTARTYNVRFDGLRVGQWSLRSKVEEVPGSCRYTLKWTSLSSKQGGAPLLRTRLCKIDEYHAGDHFDCEANRTRFFDTLLMKTKGVTCQGFDDFGQETNMSMLVAGESSEGSASGVVVSASIGDVQSLRITIASP